MPTDDQHAAKITKPKNLNILRPKNRIFFITAHFTLRPSLENPEPFITCTRDIQNSQIIPFSTFFQIYQIPTLPSFTPARRRLSHSPKRLLLPEPFSPSEPFLQGKAGILEF